MTSAAELFYNRRSRPARLSNPHPPVRDADLRKHQRSRRCAERHDWCDNGLCHGLADPPPIRSRHTSHSRSRAVRERELLSLDQQASSTYGTDNRNIDRTIPSRFDRLSLIRNKQLPSPVLQARERLLQRLRGFSLSESRQDSTLLFIHHRDSNVLISDVTETENEGELSEGSEVATTSLTGTDENVDNSSKNKPSNLSWNVLCNLRKELFKDGAINKVAKGSSDCSICLEMFRDHDELLHLSCGHRFHPACLEPWVRVSGDCPYCRARVTS